MPQVGVQCPRGRIKHEECRQCALDPLHPCMFSPDVLEKMRVHYDDPNREPGGLTFSPSRVLSCPRQAVLEDRYDYYSDVERDYPKVRGHMMHALMEASRYPGVVRTVRERRIHTTIDTSYGPQPFTGKCDLIIVKQLDDDGQTAHVNIVDYKTITKIEHSLTEAKPEHVWQVNMYAWMVTRELPHILGHDGLNVVVDGVEIEYFDMSKVRRFTSYGELHCKGKMVKRRPPEYETLTLAPIPLYPLEQIEKAIRRRVEQRIWAKEHLPPVLPEEEQWRCESCPVFDVCLRLAQEGHEDVLPSSDPRYARKNVA
jgi:hypothetical protein